MSHSPRLNLPFIQTQQAQKEVTHADALNILDAMVQLRVLSRSLTVAPSSPAAGDAYIVAASATGIWSGQDNSIAVFVNNAWQFIAPKAGFHAYTDSEGLTLRYTGSAWSVIRNAVSYLPSYTVATLPSSAIAGGLVYVTNDAGGATVAYADGINWRRVRDNVIVTV